MKNVFRKSLASAACLSLLTACQGQGAFHSKMFTKDEAAAFAKLKAATQKPKTDTPEAADVAPDTAPPQDVTPAKSPAVQPPGGSVSASSPETAAVLNAQKESQSTAAPGVNGPSVDAQGKVISENETADTLKAKNLLELQAANADAVALVSAISVNFKGTSSDQSLTFGVQAVVTLDTAERFLFVQDTPIQFSKDGSLNPLPISLQEKLDSANLLAGSDNDQVTGKALCADESCAEIQIHFDFKLKDKTVPLVLDYKWDEGAKKFQLHSNIGDHPQEFNDFIKSGKDVGGAPAAPGAAAPAAPAAAAPAAPGAAAPAAPGAAAPAAPGAAAPAAPGAAAPAAPAAAAPAAPAAAAPAAPGAAAPAATAASTLVPFAMLPPSGDGTPASLKVDSSTASPLLQEAWKTPTAQQPQADAQPGIAGLRIGQPGVAGLQVDQSQLPPVVQEAMKGQSSSTAAPTQTATTDILKAGSL